MKTIELLSEAIAKKIKWVDKNHNAEATVNGHHLEVKYPFDHDKGYQAWLDGKLVRSFGHSYGDQQKAKSFLENEVSEVGDAGTTVKSMSQYVKSSLKDKDLNGWTIDYLGFGDYLGKNKSKAFSVAYDKTIRAKSEWLEQKTYPSTHRFLIQAHFEPHREKEGLATMWLAQGGQIITFGIKSIRFNNDDLDGMIKAIKKLASISDEEIIRKLYKSGYHTYGRA